MKAPLSYSASYMNRSARCDCGRVAARLELKELSASYPVASLLQFQKIESGAADDPTNPLFPGFAFVQREAKRVCLPTTPR